MRVSPLYTACEAYMSEIRRADDICMQQMKEIAYTTYELIKSKQEARTIWWEPSWLYPVLQTLASENAKFQAQRLAAHQAAVKKLKAFMGTPEVLKGPDDGEYSLNQLISELGAADRDLVKARELTFQNGEEDGKDKADQHGTK